MKTELTIKNMVCDRCIKVVKDEFEKIGLQVGEIRLGKVTIENEISDISKVKKTLFDNGFELIKDDKDLAVERIKTLIINHIHYNVPETLGINYSDFLSKEIGKNYQHLSKVFSAHEGLTIEKFIIRQKIERAKELISYNKLSLSEIAFQLGYSNVAYLSAQFKQVTGQTASDYKNLLTDTKINDRKPLDKL